MSINLSMTNKYNGKCFVCGSVVKAQRGFLLRRDELDDPSLPEAKWLTLCNSKQCVASVVGQETAAEVDAMRIDEQGIVHMEYSDAVTPYLRALGRWDSQVKAWRISVHRRDRPHVLAIAKKLRLDVHERWLTWQDPAPVQAAVRRAAAVPTIRDYQIEGVRWFAYRGIDDSDGEHEQPRFNPKDRARGGVCGDDMGLGKTLQTLFGLHDDEALVVVCNAAAKDVWPREAKKWRPERFDVHTLIEGEENFRWPESPREMVVVNYDVLPHTPAQIQDAIEHAQAKLSGWTADADAKQKWKRRDIPSLEAQRQELLEEVERLEAQGARTSSGGRHRLFLAMSPLAECEAKITKVEKSIAKARARKPVARPSCSVWLVGDELHYVENNKALRTQRWRALARRARRVVGLTGTPVESEPLKLWGLLTSAQANPFGWQGFIEAFNGQKGMWGGYEFERLPPLPGSTARGPVKTKPGTTEQLRRVLMRRTQEQVLDDLPPKVFSEIPVKVSSSRLRKQLDEFTSTHIDSILSGDVPFELLSKTLEVLARECIPTMLDLVSSFEQQQTPVVVFSANRAPVEALRKRKGWFTVLGGETSHGRVGEIEDRFQAGEGVGVAGTEAMAESVTLTRACNLIQVIPFMRRKKNQQAYKRLQRFGQQNTVNIILLVPDHPLVHHILALLVAKDQFVEAVLKGDSSPDVDSFSRLVDEDEQTWRARVEAKARADEERERRAAARELAKRERELAEIAASGKVTPKVSEQRAKLRAQRLIKAHDGSDHGVLARGFDAKTVKAALEHMLARCDGAVEKENEGFNKPDGAAARWLAPGVAKGSTYAVASAAAILRRYPKQLEERWPELFT